MIYINNHRNTHRWNMEMKIMRHYVQLKTGENFFFVDEIKANRFHAREIGSVYHGFVNVPNENRPLMLRD